MSEMRITDSFKVLIRTSTNPTKATGNLVRDFMVRLDALNATCALESFSVVQDANNPKRFAYKFVTKNARKWNQTILLEEGLPEAWMTYNVPDMFKPSEVNTNIALRNAAVIPLLMAGVTKIVCNWN